MAEVQLLLILVVILGSILNVLARPWSSTESILERRRNDLAALLLWFFLIIFAIYTSLAALRVDQTDDAFDIQDWTALILPFALAAPYLLELTATLVRQIEIWRWMRVASVQALPLAWMYRTKTVGEEDSDGEWLRSQFWVPATLNGLSMWKHFPQLFQGFFNATSREASLHSLYRRWLLVLLSALGYLSNRGELKAMVKAPLRSFQTLLGIVLVMLLIGLTAVLFGISYVEYTVLLTLDVFLWMRNKMLNRIVPHYEAVHFGRREMQMVFESSTAVRSSLRVDQLLVNKWHEKDAPLLTSQVHNQIMCAVITTTAVLENSFRQAYLVTPVFKLCISNRKVLREQYNRVGCQLDRLIKQVRQLLELRHTTGLLSITSPTGTVEASLHDNIESILSIALYFKPLVLYRIASRTAVLEHNIENGLASNVGHMFSQEDVTRERCVYIDARNGMFWLLWVVILDEWEGDGQGDHIWERKSFNELTEQDIRDIVKEFPDDRIEKLYVLATFMSRCRYAGRFDMGNEHKYYWVVRKLGEDHGKKGIMEMMGQLSSALKHHRNFTLLEWLGMEYGLEWKGEPDENGECQFSVVDDSGLQKSATCQVVLTPTICSEVAICVL